MVIVQRFQLLDIDQNHGNVQILHRGEHVVGSGIGQQLQKDQVHVRGRNRSPAAWDCSLVVTIPPSMISTVSGSVFLNASY